MWKKVKKQLDSSDSFISLALGLAVVLAIGMLIFQYIGKNQQAATIPNTTSNDTSQRQKALPATYTVKSGDTLWSIAESFYKSGYNWVDIAKANNLVNPNDIEEGQILKIPNVLPIVPQNGQISSASTERAKDATYTVIAGDTLWAIAVKEYNDGYKWPEIAKANNLNNPDLIHSGNVLQLP